MISNNPMGRPKITNGSGGGGGGGPSNNMPHNLTGEDAEQEAAERNLIRRCIDYHNPAVIDIQNRLYYKSNILHHVRNRYDYLLLPHHTYIRHYNIPASYGGGSIIPSQFYTTYCAHITRAKNSTPIICLSWTPGGRRLLTGNHEGEFTLWDGSKYNKNNEKINIVLCYSNKNKQIKMRGWRICEFIGSRMCFVASSFF